MTLRRTLQALFTVCGILVFSSLAHAADKKPNILVIMTDDVGIWNISAYHRGMMGGSTPNIDRIAKTKARYSPTTMPSNRARPVGPRSSLGRHRFARGC